MKFNLFLEALPLSQAKEYTKLGAKEVKARYDLIFGPKKDRIYLDFKSDKLNVTKTLLYQEIDDYLKDLNYEITDYINGYAKEIDGKRVMRIGKLLAKVPTLLKKFQLDPARQVKSNELQIVISRHPYDLAGMSTDRGWTSCMDLKAGCNKSYVKEDIKEGTLIAYLISKDDRNIKHPLGRVLIKPYKNEEKNKIILKVSNSNYGELPGNFNTEVQKFIDEKFNKVKPDDFYELTPKLYNDSGDERILYKGDIKKWKGKIWNDGTWEGGTWIDGIWKFGKWSDGTWKNGLWKDGTWKNGKWINGIWKFGFWYNGTWEDGTWKNGIWKNGHWKDGTWLDGTWYNGTWYNGIWKNGTWEDGIWKTGRWKDGLWYDGTWEDGIWESGFWKNGTWKGGRWDKGAIFNPITKKHEESNVNPTEFYKNIGYKK